MSAPTPRRPRRSLLAVLATTLLAIAAIVIPVSAASALPTLVTCTGTENDTASPGITNTSSPQTVTAQASYPVCVHVVGGLTVSTMTASNPGTVYTFDASCTELLVTGPTGETIHWSNGQTSTFSTTATVNSVSGVLTYTQVGTVTAGLYAGASVVQTFVFPALSPTACAGAGVTSYSGSASFVITQL